MNIRDEQYLCNRVRVIDSAVGGLEGKVAEQEELIKRLKKRINKLEGKFQFWFLHNELSDNELEQIALNQETKEGGDDGTPSTSCLE